MLDPNLLCSNNVVTDFLGILQHLLLRESMQFIRLFTDAIPETFRPRIVLILHESAG